MKLAALFIYGSLMMSAFAWTEYFNFETIPMPEGIDPQVGAMEFLPNGKMAVAFHRGEVMLFDTKTKIWSPFASGLQEPLGMLAEPDGSLLVMQRAELTRIKDTDKDGLADLYETVFDHFGMSGNYHEFNYGPARDSEGNLYIVLGLASNGAPIADEIRGEFSKIGKANREQMTSKKDWEKNKEISGRMYSRVPWRGWVLKISPDGKTMEPYACGFRSPNGIGFDAKGRLLVTDNQGDWRATSPLYSVKKDGFYGHPASLIWRENWDGRNPLELSDAELKKISSPAVGLFEQGVLANSPTSPVIIPENGFSGIFAKQTLIGEMNQANLVRVIGDEVEGVHQTAFVSMFEDSSLGMGNNRLSFDQDGSLYVGKTGLSWPGSKGITRVEWNGKPFLALTGIKAVSKGFQLEFNQEIEASSLKKLSITRFQYRHTIDYGGPQLNVESPDIQQALLSEDKKSVIISIESLKENFVHKIDLSALRSSKGLSLMGDSVYYNVLKAPK